MYSLWSTTRRNKQEIEWLITILRCQRAGSIEMNFSGAVLARRFIFRNPRCFNPAKASSVSERLLTPSSTPLSGALDFASSSSYHSSWVVIQTRSRTELLFLPLWRDRECARSHHITRPSLFMRFAPVLSFLLWWWQLYYHSSSII